MLDLEDAMDVPKWSTEEKLVLFERLISLYDSEKRWMKDRVVEEAKELEKEIKELDKMTLEERKLLNQEGPGEEILELLKTDPEIERICKRKKPEEILEFLEHTVFRLQKKYDSMKYEQAIEEKKLRQKYLELENLEKGQDETMLPQIVKECNRVAAEIQRLTFQRQTAENLHGDYEKVIRILEKEARGYDKVLNGLKAEMTIQCECIVKMLELGQKAILDGKELAEKYQKLVEAEKEADQQTVDKVKAMVELMDKAKQAAGQMLPPNSYNPSEELSPEVQEYQRQMEETAAKLEDDIELLMETTKASSPEDIFYRCERILKERYYLLRELDVNTIRRDTEQMRVDHMDHMLESIRHTATQESRDHEKEMAALREEIRKEKEECRKLYRDIAQDGYYIHKIRLAMVHFNKMLDGVSPAGPGPEFEELGINVEELPTFVDALEPHKGTEEEFLRVARQDIPRDYEETDQLGEEPLDDMLYDVDLTHLVDNVQLKVMMLMKQVGDLQLTEEEMKEAEQLYERRVVESLKPMRKPKKIVPLPAEKGFRGKKIPTRIELKNASRRFADEHETRPPPPDPHEKLAKHDCI